MLATRPVLLATLVLGLAHAVSGQDPSPELTGLVNNIAQDRGIRVVTVDPNLRVNNPSLETAILLRRAQQELLDSKGNNWIERRSTITPQRIPVDVYVATDPERNSGKPGVEIRASHSGPHLIIVMGANGADGLPGSTVDPNTIDVYGVGGTGGEMGPIRLDVDVFVSAIVYPGNGGNGGHGLNGRSPITGRRLEQSGGPGGIAPGVQSFVWIRFAVGGVEPADPARWPQLLVMTSHWVGLLAEDRERSKTTSRKFGSGGLGGLGGAGASFPGGGADDGGDGGKGGEGVSVKIEAVFPDTVLGKSGSDSVRQPDLSQALAAKEGWEARPGRLGLRWMSSYHQVGQEAAAMGEASIS